jgi:hypothetical protein
MDIVAIPERGRLLVQMAGIAFPAAAKHRKAAPGTRR